MDLAEEGDGLHVLVGGFNSEPAERSTSHAPQVVRRLNQPEAARDLRLQASANASSFVLFSGEAEHRLTALSHSARANSPATSTSSMDSEDEQEAPQASYPRFLPEHVYRQSLRELSQGGKFTMLKCMNMWQDAHLTDESFLSFVESIQWQSQALTTHLKGSESSDDAKEEECELLSPDDMAMLMVLGTNSTGATSPREGPVVSGRNGSCFEQINQPASKKQRTSPALTPQTLTQREVQKVLDVVSDPCLLDSAKTNQLTQLLVMTRDLAKYFDNYWSPQSARFVAVPDWKAIEDKLLVALPLLPCRHVSTLHL